MRALIAVSVLAVAVVGSGYISAGTVATRATFTVTPLSSLTLDIGPAGPGIGDVIIRRWRVTDRNGTTQGFAHEVCRSTTALVELCTAVYSLSTGSIVVEGTTGDRSATAITGGTGEYIGAAGQATRQGRVVKFVFK